MSTLLTAGTFTCLITHFLLPNAALRGNVLSCTLFLHRRAKLSLLSGGVRYVDFLFRTTLLHASMWSLSMRFSPSTLMLHCCLLNLSLCRFGLLFCVPIFHTMLVLIVGPSTPNLICGFISALSMNLLLISQLMPSSLRSLMLTPLCRAFHVILLTARRIVDLAALLSLPLLLYLPPILPLGRRRNLLLLHRLTLH